jgi:GntR family transcriptional regulator, transcriptional repressor for pyruvate dehydrogenase complex
MIDSYRPVKRQEKLSIQVADQIIDLILDGKLKEGDRLPPERELCETFGVSRTVIREAVSVLEAKGLVSSVTGSGTYVRSIQAEDVVSSLGLYISTMSKSVSMMHLLEIRLVIEPRVARLAAERATEEDIQDLQEIWLAMCRLSHSEDTETFAKKDLDFHVRLARASHNPLFEIVLQPLTDVLYQLIYVGSGLPGAAKEACAYHRTVLDAIEAHDADRAAKAIMDHLKQTERVTSKGLREQEKKEKISHPEE